MYDIVTLLSYNFKYNLTDLNIQFRGPVKISREKIGTGARGAFWKYFDIFCVSTFCLY